MSSASSCRKSPRRRLKGKMESPQPAKAPSSPPGSPSSDSVCAICLGRHENKCFTNSCMHEFCFNCLLEWSKVKAECPLCKQPFSSIIHNIKSNSEYDIHKVDVLPPQEPEISAFDFQRHRYRTTMTAERYYELQVMRRSNELRLFMNEGILPPGPPNRSRSRVSGTTAFRRERYARDLWVRPLADVTNRFRDSTPDFFRHNPAGHQRLIPWLSRELKVLLPPRHANLMSYVFNTIMRLLPSHHICSRSFRDAIEPYLGPNTEHFVHEFYTFARSPYDMRGFDDNAVYEPRSSYQVEEVAVTESSDDEDASNVRVMREIPLPPSPQPGPSGLGRPAHVVDDGQSYTASSSTRPTDTDEDDEVEIVQVVRPRTPELITLVSESDEAEVAEAREASSSSAARGKSLKSSSPARETSRKDKKLKPLRGSKKKKRRERSSSSTESSDREQAARNSNNERQKKRRAPPPMQEPRRYWDMDPEDLPNHRPSKRTRDRSHSRKRNKS